MRMHIFLTEQEAGWFPPKSRALYGQTVTVWVVQQQRKFTWVRCSSYFMPATMSVNIGIHPSQSKAKWEGSTPCSHVNWNQVHHACFDALLLRIDVMAFYGIHFHWTSTWFDIIGRGEKMCRDQQKLKLELVFLCHYFCDLDKTSTFDKAQYWQLLVTSTVSLHLKGIAARKSPSKQTEKHSSASVWHMPVKAPGTNRYFCTNKNWAHYCNTAIFQSCLFRCKKAE